jgi:hypothetical protein
MQVEVTESYRPNFIMFDAAIDTAITDGSAWIDYVYDGRTMCRPKSGQVNMRALTSCYVNTVDFTLTGGNKDYRSTDSNFPFNLYGDSCNDRCSSAPPFHGSDGFELSTWYTVTAIPDGDNTRAIVRSFMFDRVCN